MHFALPDPATTCPALRQPAADLFSREQFGAPRALAASTRKRGKMKSTCQVRGGIRTLRNVAPLVAATLREHFDEGLPQSAPSFEEAAFVLRTSPEIVRERARRVGVALTVSLDAKLA